MFTGTIHTVKWFLMKQALHSMLACYFFQCFHNQLVVINCNVCFCIDRCQLVLCRCYFVMLCFCGDTKFPEFFVDIFHIRSNTLTDGSEIMVIQFLSFRRHCSEQGTSGKDQIFSLQIFLFVNQEVFLFRSNGRCYFFGGCISKQSQKSQCLLVDCFHGTQQRCFLIQCLTCVRAECGRNTEDRSCCIFTYISR